MARSMGGEERAFEFTQEVPMRIDHFLVSMLPDLSRSYIQGLIKDGHVTVDGTQILKTGYKLDQRALVEAYLPPAVDLDLVPEPIPLEILYEDQDLIVINKPAGMVVHPSAGHTTGTLVHAILAHAQDIKGIGGVKRPGIVHRLDKDTSGALVVAKNDSTHRFLQAEFKKRNVKKIYLALVDSHPPTSTGRIEAAISRDPSHRQRMAIVSEDKGRMAISEYKTIDSFPEHSLLEVNILTGRTHQIRLHLAYLNCPVVGDRIYGYKKPSLDISRQLLHAHKLSFKLPSGPGKKEFIAPLPDDFNHILKGLRR
jgi:23S rRNA pseudouridine1911/1915/1917 synthase